MADVEFAIMESDGAINVLLTRENQALTPKDMGIKVAPEKESQAVIMDGKILDEPLDTLNLSRGWLQGQLEKQGLTAENVYLSRWIPMANLPWIYMRTRYRCPSRRINPSYTHC